MVHFTIVVVIATLAFVGYSRGEDIEMDQGCEGTYCTIQPKNYNTFITDEVIQESKYWAGNGVKINHPEYFVPQISPSDDNNCGSISTVIQPYTISVMVNKTNQPVNKLVIQTEFFQQNIRITNCLYKDKPCFDDITSEQDDIKASCSETFTGITLFVYENNKIMPWYLSVPVSCACKVGFKSM